MTADAPPAISTASGPTAEIVASLNLDSRFGAIFVKVVQTPDLNRTITADCVRLCSSAIHYREDVGDYPLGLFRRWDGDELVYSIWAGGSTY